MSFLESLHGEVPLTNFTESGQVITNFFLRIGSCYDESYILLFSSSNPVATVSIIVGWMCP